MRKTSKSQIPQAILKRFNSAAQSQLRPQLPEFPAVFGMNCESSTADFTKQSTHEANVSQWHSLLSTIVLRELAPPMFAAFADDEPALPVSRTASATRFIHSLTQNPPRPSQHEHSASPVSGLCVKGFAFRLSAFT